MNHYHTWFDLKPGMRVRLPEGQVAPSAPSAQYREVTSDPYVRPGTGAFVSFNDGPDELYSRMTKWEIERTGSDA